MRVIRFPTLQVSQFLFPGQRSDTFLTDLVYTDGSKSEHGVGSGIAIFTDSKLIDTKKKIQIKRAMFE